MMKNWKKKLVSCLLTFVLTAVLLPTFLATPAEAAMSGYTAWTNTNSLPTSGSYYLNTDVTMISKVVTLTGDLYLDLNGHTITFTGSNSNSAFIVKGDYRWFDLYDSVGGGKIVESSSATYDRAVWVEGTGARFYMHGGTIDGFRSSYDGAGVYIKNGSMTMSGGTIQNCKANANSGTYNGGGGGVYVNSGCTFTMYSGDIYNNTARLYGGGVFCYGTFNMSGGTIRYNTAGEHGGGVNINSCTFTMSGGSISYNTGTKLGGGVHSYNATFNMSAGSVSLNKTNGDGGGVQLESSTIYMSGGDIYNNTAGLSGGGIGCHSGTVNVSGGTIDYNTAKDDGGGGIGGWDSAKINISGSAHIYGNSATNTTSGKGQGGAIMGRRSTAITFNGGRIGSGNTAYGISTVYSDNAVTYNSGRFYTGSSYTSNPTSKYSTITFNQNSGNNGTSSISYQYWNSNLPNITVPSRTGYTFNGYKNSNGELYYNANGTPYNKSGDGIKWDYIGAQTLTAQWTPITYTIAYDTNGGEGTINSTAATYDANATLAAAPTRTGYTFNGWNTVADGTGTTYQAGASVSNLTSTNGATVTLYAQWTPNTYTVTLNNDGGKCDSLTSYTYGEGATLPTPTRDKYVFSGWFEDEKFTGSPVEAISSTDYGDKTFFARWLTVTDWHLESGKCDVGGLMGHQYNKENGTIGRTIIGLTDDMLAKIGDKLVIVGGDYDKETTVTIDCAYTYFYDDNKMITAESMKCAAFVIIEDDKDGKPISGYGYYRLYSDSEDNFLFDVMYKDPSKN